MCSVDDWLELDPYSEFVYIQFDSTVVASSIERQEIDISEALFGMGLRDTFDCLRNAISSFCGVDRNILHLFWNGSQLNYEDTPQLIGMEPAAECTEQLFIFVGSIET